MHTGKKRKETGNGSFTGIKLQSLRNRLLSMMLAFATLCSVWAGAPVLAQAGASLPALSSTRYWSTYTYPSSGKVYAYTDASLKTKTGGYIDCATDECRITAIKGDAVQVSYPVSGGRRTAWFERAKFTYRDLAGEGSQKIFTCNKKITTYKWKNQNNTFGYISSGDVCYLLRGDSGSEWLQLIYPTGNTFKMAWVKGSDIKSVLWPAASAKISLSSGSVSVQAGQTFTLTASHVYSGNCHYSYETSGNSGYANLSWGSWNSARNACPLYITGKSAGSFRVRVSLCDASTGQALTASGWTTVTVTAQPAQAPQTIQPTGISLSAGNFTFNKIGATRTLTATVSPSNATNKNVTWTSSNTGVATVDASGKITAKKNGKTTITAKTSNGISKSITVTVKAETSAEKAVKARLDKIANGSYRLNSSTVLQVGKKFTGTKAGEQCKGYGKDVFYCLFKIWPSSTKADPNNHKINSTNGMKQIASSSSLTAAAAKKLFSSARPGDFVQMRRSHGGSHTAIVYSVSSTGVTFQEANLDGKNTIYRRTYTWQQLAQKNEKMTVYTATDYKLK